MIDTAKFYKRLEHVGAIATMMKRTFNILCKLGHCAQQDADSLCLSDDTAAWLCGRVETCYFVSFRVHIDKFCHPNSGLKHFKFEESLLQSEHVGVRYTYMNYDLFKNTVALKLVVYTRTSRENMYADGLPYFVQNFSESNCKRVSLYVRNSCATLLTPLPAFEQLVEDSINELVKVN